MGNHKKLLQFLRPNPPPLPPDCDGDTSYSTPMSVVASPFAMLSWTQLPGLGGAQTQQSSTGLLGSLVKEDGHVYSLAASGDLLYMGTDSCNVRVWRDRHELGGFRSRSGLVKAIVVAAAAACARRGGELNRSAAPWLCHLDVIVCFSLDPAAGLLYVLGVWDKTVKVWRVPDARYLESVSAHNDAVNAVAHWQLPRPGNGRSRSGGGLRGHGRMAVLCLAAAGHVVASGFADRTVCVWQRQINYKSI